MKSIWPAVTAAPCTPATANLRATSRGKNYCTLSSSYKEAWPASEKVGLWGGESQKQPITSSKILKYTGAVLGITTPLRAHGKQRALKSTNHLAKVRRERKGSSFCRLKLPRQGGNTSLTPQTKAEPGSSNICQRSYGCRPPQLLELLWAFFAYPRKAESVKN